MALTILEIEWCFGWLLGGTRRPAGCLQIDPPAIMAQRQQRPTQQTDDHTSLTPARHTHTHTTTNTHIVSPGPPFHGKKDGEELGRGSAPAGARAAGAAGGHCGLDQGPGGAVRVCGLVWWVVVSVVCWLVGRSAGGCIGRGGALVSLFDRASYRSIVD